MTRDVRAATKAINDILWRDWDPIGCGVPEDEYESYVWPVYRMLASGETGEEVAERLRWIARTQMNCAVPETRLAVVVDKLDGARSQDALAPELSRYWLAHRMRAIQATSLRDSSRGGYFGLSEISSTMRAFIRPICLASIFAADRLGHHTIALAHRRAGRNDNAVARAIERLHRIAGDFEGIDRVGLDAGEADLVPAIAHRKACIVEIAFIAGLGEAKKGRGPAGAAFGEGCKVLDRRADSAKRLGQAFGGEPARRAIGVVALGLVERGRVKTGAAGKARGAEAVAFGQLVNGLPDVSVAHGAGCVLQEGVSIGEYS